MIKLLRRTLWKASNFFLGRWFPNITISYVKNGELNVRLRADGFVIISDKSGTNDGLPINMINPKLVVELINAQQWPWQTPVTLKDLENCA